MTKKMTMTNHVINDRMNRLLYIAQTIGWGEIIAEDFHGTGRECLTSTGVVLVKATDAERLITAWIADVDRATAIWRGAGKGNRMPDWLMRRIANNAKHRKHCQQKGALIMDNWWELNAKSAEENFGCHVDWAERYYICPECQEPVFEEDWGEEILSTFLCPICEFEEE